MKAFLYAEHVLTCYAARKLERPVKWASERGEAFLSDTHGRDNVTLGELAIDKDGIFLALRTRNIANMGAYLSTFAPYIPTFAGGAVLSGVYGFRAIHANVLGVFTHTVPVDAYRGAGRPESNYLLERLVDAAARELNIDRAELRRRNMVPPSAMPHATPVGKTYDSGDFPRVLDSALSGWTTPGSRHAARTRQSAASAAASACRTISKSRWAIRPSGRKSASPRMASSMSTSAPSPPVRVTKPRTSSSLPTTSASTARRSASARAIPTRSRVGGGTGGSRSLYSEGQAILVTADTVIDKGKQAAAEMLEAAPADIAFADGRFSIVGTDRGIDIIALAATQRQKAAAGEPAIDARRRRSGRTSPSTPSRMAAIWPRWKSIPRPAWWTSSATACATTSARR